MKKFWLLSATLVVLSASMFADSIYTGSGTTSNGTTFGIGATSTFCCSAAPSTTNSQSPFWNNYSGDTVGANAHQNNVGDILAGSSTGTNLLGGTTNLTGTPTVLGTSTQVNGSYYALTSGAGGDPVTVNTTTTNVTPALDFQFQSTQTSYAISLLFADSGNNTGTSGTATSIGTYIMLGGVFTEASLIDGAVANNTTGTATALTVTNAQNNNELVVNNGTIYGFYATVCYAFTGTTCTASVTYTTGNGNFVTPGFTGTQDAGWLGSLGWNHFALFNLASGEEVLGFEDSPWAITNSSAGGEAEGDFNDVVIGLVGNTAQAAPEPGTIAIMGLGLAGLGILGRRRFAKK
jgi:PEP-CTERM motif